MNFKKLTALGMGLVLTASVLAGCGSSDSKNTSADANNTSGDGATATESTESTESGNGEITDFTMFIAMPGSEINDGNEVQQIIAEKTGVRVKETWLTGQTAEEAVGTIIAGGEYPDFIDAGNGSTQMYEAGALVPLDDYIEKYPNIKEMYSDEEWEKFRQDDGHIYWINVFQNHYGEDRTTTHNDEAFWIQCKVLEWAGYPEIKTLDQYFKVLEDYVAANPAMEDGTTYIPYTMLCDDWRYFCIENAGQFLDGYPNDGSVIVDVDNMKIVDYNTTETTKKYFKKLNEEYQKGMIDPEFATQIYDEYISKLSTGRVLGMCDQWWDFAYTVNDVFKSQGLDVKGCNYVPLGLTIEEGMDNQWHTYSDTLNESSGIAITTSCKDPDKAAKFLSDMLEQEIHDLRFWGVEGVDYLVDDDGMYYRTDEMRKQCADTDYKANHMCGYTYFPQWLGTSKDGKNAMQPTQQTSEFFNGLAEPLVNTFKAYGAENYVDMIGSKEVEMGIWFPMYSFSNNMTTETPGGVAWTKMGEVKHEWLPKVVMGEDFDAVWDQYMKAYEGCDPQSFLDEMQAELDRRAALAK
ncbi:MAG: sugar ABC transporter substrate-binding protein [Lachnospiraceae bacterium]|nr:sugar ABC transporter substrate-binding protein [Lachnospiraceae bacterium]